MHITCCKDCTKRHPHCHSSCEDYIREKAENDRIREGIHKQKQVNMAMFEHVVRLADRTNKNRHKRR